MALPSALRILLTGGAGFVGAHFVEHLIKHTDWHIVVFDRLTYAGDLNRLREIHAFTHPHLTVLTADFNQPIVGNLIEEIGPVDYIWHLGAETHVDNSIRDPHLFVHSNVLGTLHLLNFARHCPSLKAFYYFSTDEVFGPAPPGHAFSEDDRHAPGNPYAATKSAAEALVHAYRNTYGLPAVITRSMNIFGERQHHEKYIPLCVRKLLLGETVYIHASPDRHTSGSRFYIHARNVAAAYIHLIEHGDIGEDYHIVGECELSNLSLAHTIAEFMDRPLHYELVDFHSSRPGHDLRYALDGQKLARLGWCPPKTFSASLEQTVRWMTTHPRWLGLTP